MRAGRRAAAGLVALAWLVGCHSEGPGRDEVVRQARREARAGRFREARAILAALPDSGPVEAEAADLLGACEHADGRFEAALAAWGRVDPGSPRWPSLALARARTLAGNLGRFAEAEATLEAALDRAGPLRLDVAHALLRLYHLEGRSDAMTRLIRRTRPDWRDPAAELRDLWLVEHSVVDLDEVRRALDAAEAKAPEDDRVRLGRAALAIREHRLDDAAGPLDDCLRRRPDDPAVRLARLQRARAAGDVDGVEAELARLPASSMAEPDRVDLAAWLATQHGEGDRARLAYERRVALGPASPTALARLAAIESRNGHPDRAVDLLRRKATLDAARERYRRLVEDRPPVEGFAELGELAEALGRPFEALGWWSLAGQARPGDPAVRRAIDRLEAAEAIHVAGPAAEASPG